MLSYISPWMVYLLIGLFTAYFALYLYYREKFSYWEKRGVKSLPPTFFFGNVMKVIFAKQVPIELIWEVYNAGKDEKVMGFYVFTKPYLVIRDLECVKHVTIKDFNIFSNKILGSAHDDPIGNPNLFFSRNPPWKYMRQNFTQMFSSGKLRMWIHHIFDLRPDFDSHMDTFGLSTDKDTIVDVAEVAGNLTTDMIGATVLGMRLNSLTDSKAMFRKIGRSIMHAGYARYLELLAIFLIPSFRPVVRPWFFTKEGTDYLISSFWEVINERIKTGKVRNDLIDILIELRESLKGDPNAPVEMDGDLLIAQAAVFFLGGFETSASTTLLTCYEMAKHPDVQTKLRKEIHEWMRKNNGKITYEMLTQAPYLSIVLKEVMRLYPIIPFLDRIPEVEYTFPGTDITIEPGTPCILPVRPLQNDEKYFPDPEKFDPERWNEENKSSIPMTAYLPFGEGPRNCIGARLGELQVKIAIIYFMSKYEYALSEKTNIPLILNPYGIMTHSKNGMPLKVRRVPDGI